MTRRLSILSPAALAVMGLLGLGLVGAGCRTPDRGRRVIPVILPTHTFVRFQTPDGKSLAKVLEEPSAQGGRRIDFRVRVIGVATRERPGERLGATTHPDHGWTEIGTWQLPHWKEKTNVPAPAGADGQLLTDLAPPFFVSAAIRDEILQTQEVKVQDEILTFVIDPPDVRSRLAGFRIRVAAPTNESLADASVDVTDADTGGTGWRTDSHGVVAVSDYLPGLLILRVEAQGYGRVERWVRLPPGRVTDLGDLKLDYATAIEGRVVDPDGGPVPALMRFYFLDELGSPQDLDDLAWSGMRAREGRFRRDLCRKGRYLIQAWSGFARRVVVVDTSAGDARDAEIRVEPGRTVSFQGGPGDVGRLVEVRDSSDLLVVSCRFRGAPRTEAILAPGDYRLSLYDDETLVRRRSFSVGAEPLTLQVTEP